MLIVLTVLLPKFVNKIGVDPLVEVRCLSFTALQQIVAMAVYLVAFFEFA